MSKVLLDGYGIKLKAIRGTPDNSCPDKEHGYRKIIVETDKGEFVIWGCSQCHVISGRWKNQSS